MTNNYNSNKNGLSVSITLFKDYEISRDDFENNFEILQHQDYSKNLVCLYTREEISEKDLKLEDYYNIFDDEHNREILEEETKDFFDEPSKQTFKDLLESFIDKIFDYEYWSENFEEELDEYKIHYEQKFTRVISRGYCQGDYAEVIVLNEIRDNCFLNKKELEEIEREFLARIERVKNENKNFSTEQIERGLKETLTREKKEKHIKKWIDRILWNSPLYCNIVIDEINRELYAIYEELGKELDEYETSEEDAKEVIKEWAEKNYKDKDLQDILDVLEDVKLIN